MEALLKGMRRFGDGMNVVLRIFLGATSIALCVAVIGQFIARWFGQTISWATEFACLIFLCSSMFGSAVASRHLLHIGVDLVINLFHGKVKTVIQAFAYIVLIAALLLFIVSSAQYTIQQISHTATTFKVSVSVFYISLPVCGIAMLYYTVAQMLETIFYGAPVKIELPGSEEEGVENA